MYLNIPIKFLNITLEALQYRIASMKAILNEPNTPDEELAIIDYGNDIPILESVISDLEKAKAERVIIKQEEISPVKLINYKEIQEAWANDKQILFAKEISFRITISVRDINFDSLVKNSEKLNAIIAFNEIQHYILGYRAVLESEYSNNEQYCFFNEILRQLSNNEITRNYIHFLIIESFQKINQIPDKNFNDFSQEYLVYHQALNEVCNGAYALPDWEFGTLMGVSKSEALMLLNRENDLWKKQ